jgi:hypothetical protein
MNVFSLADELLFDGNVLKVNPTNMGNILNLAGKMFFSSPEPHT